MENIRNLILKTFLYYPQVRGIFGGEAVKIDYSNIDVFIKIDIWGAEAKRNSIG